MSDYIPEVPVPDDFKLDNVPLIVIGFISTLILILRWLCQAADGHCYNDCKTLYNTQVKPWKFEAF